MKKLADIAHRNAAFLKKEALPELAEVQTPPSKKTERGEMLKYFMVKLNATRKPPYKSLTMSRMGRILQAVPTKDLYYLQRVCEDSGRKGADAFAKRFWWEINPKKHTNPQST